MTYQLDPTLFKCSTHTADDLTKGVQAAVDALPLPVPRVGFAPFGRKRKARGTFTVVVECPGDGTPHTVVCKGTYGS